MFEWMPRYAARSRHKSRRRIASYFLATTLVVLASLDVMSTNAGLAKGGVETNNLMQWFQETLGHWWVLPRLLVQIVPAVMVLWYPHPAVLMAVLPVVPIIGYAVWNNFTIAGLI